MKKMTLLLLLLLGPAIANAQVVGGPVFGCAGAISTGSVWNSGTSASTTQAIVNNSPVFAVLVQLDQSSGTFSAGAITFQGTYDGVNWVTVPAAQVVNPNNSFALLSNPYTLVTSTNQPFLVILQGFASIRLDLSTAITGTGTVTPYYLSNCNPQGVSPVSATQSPNSASNPLSVQQAPVTGSTPATSVCLLTANTTAASCKASAGNLYGFSIYNPNSSLCVLQIFNTSSVTLGTTQEILDIPVLSTGGNNLVLNFPVNFSADIYVASTTAAHGSTTCTTGMLVNILYE